MKISDVEYQGDKSKAVFYYTADGRVDFRELLKVMASEFKVYENIVPLKPEDIAETIYWMATRPAHVNINDLIIMPTIQANATTVLR